MEKKQIVYVAIQELSTYRNLSFDQATTQIMVLMAK